MFKYLFFALIMFSSASAGNDNDIYIYEHTDDENINCNEIDKETRGCENSQEQKK